jgi:uncharacterized membrane protein SpoIIM required for sporulation
VAIRPEVALSAWLQGRAAQWQRLSRILTEVSVRRQADLTQLKELMSGYRALARDVSLARAAAPDAKLVARLEALLTQAREVIHRRPGNVRDALTGLFRDGAPRVVFGLRSRIAAVTTLFFASAASGWWLVHRYPELAALFASEQMINSVQRGELWTDGLINIVPSALLSLGIMTNNIVVSLFAFTLGALYGLGTLYIVGMNGLMLGGVFAMTAQNGLAGRLGEFVVAHGMVEISVILLAAAAGVELGEALARPGNRSRATAFREAVRHAGQLLPLCGLFLVGAGLIEGYVSPDPNFTTAQRVAIGVAYWILLILVLSGRLWRRPRKQAVQI